MTMIASSCTASRHPTDQPARTLSDLPGAHRHPVWRRHRHAQWRRTGWRRPDIRREAGREPAQVFIPQTHRPGRDAEVDFGEVWIDLAGKRTNCHLFTFRMSFSGKSVHRVSASGGQEAFFEGHVHALDVLGGVPTGKVRYDNLTSAVRQVLGFKRARVENERWVAFRSHYSIDAFYCVPGLEGRMRKAGSRARSAASAATTWCRCPRSSRWPSSTR
jgi:hypothetical protein